MKKLKEKSARALLWELVGNYGGQLSGFIISIFLARLLEPSEFGLVGMSLVFINLMKIIIDVGFSQALIQNQQNSSITYSSVFILNMLCASLLTLAIYLSAPAIADFYERDEITNLIRLVSISFFISGFNIVQHTILRIELDFKNITFRDLTSKVIAGIIAIIFAYSGYGVYALVIQLILSEVIKTVLLWKITSWYPKFEFSWAEIQKLFGFSAYVLAGRVVNKVFEELDALLVGKIFSPAVLGFYTRSLSFNNLIIKNSSRSITQVFFPVLSKVKDDPSQFNRIFYKTVSLIASISILITGIFYLTSEELIVGLFGEKWFPSVFIFQVLVIKGFAYPISSMIVNAFWAKGKSKQNFYYGNIKLVFRLVPLGMMLIYGFEMFLYSLVGVSLLNLILNFLFAKISLNLSFIKQLKSILPYLSIAVFLVILLEFLFPEGLNYLVAFVKASIFITSYLFICYLLKSELTLEAVKFIKGLNNKFLKTGNM